MNRIMLCSFALMLTAVAALGTQSPEVAVEVVPSAASLEEQARKHIEDDEYFEALALLNQAIQLDPSRATAYLRRARVHDWLGGFGAALADCDRAIELLPNIASSYWFRAEIAFRAGRFEKSVKDFDKYVSIVPKDERALHRRALSLYFHGDYARAAKQCELSFGPFGRVDELALIHFLCNLRMHGLATAKERALQIEGNGMKPAQFLMDVFQEKKTADALLKHFEIKPPFHQRERNSQILYLLGLWHDAHGRAKEAGEFILNAYKANYRQREELIDDAVLVHEWLLKEKPDTHPQESRKTIVYVVDASGSTVGVLPFILSELKRSLNGLSDRQGFTILFFQNGRCIEPLAAGIKSCSSNNRSQIYRWMDSDQGNLVPQGTSDPRAAIKRALELNPALIFILSDGLTGRGRFEINQKVLREDIIKLNTNKTKINCIQFLRGQETVTDANWSPTLKLIATDSGGLYKFVSPREAGIEE